MEASPVFLKLRAVAFLCITILSLAWIVVLCVMIFYRWDISDHGERSLILIILLTNTITVIALPVLMLLQFRPWLDAARFLFLLVAHIGTAVGFTAWNPTFTCPEQTADQTGECKLINMYILLGNWVVPAFLIAYSAGLALMVYRHTRRSALTTGTLSNLSSENDEEATVGRGSILPMMTPDMAERRSAALFPAETAMRPVGALASYRQSMYSDARQKAAFILEHGSRKSTARLSKPVPALYF